MNVVILKTTLRKNAVYRRRKGCICNITEILKVGWIFPIPGKSMSKKNPRSGDSVGVLNGSYYFFSILWGCMRQNLNLWSTRLIYFEKSTQMGHILTIWAILSGFFKIYRKLAQNLAANRVDQKFKIGLSHHHNRTT